MAHTIVEACAVYISPCFQKEWLCSLLLFLYKQMLREDFQIDFFE